MANPEMRMFGAIANNETALLNISNANIRRKPFRICLLRINSANDPISAPTPFNPSITPYQTSPNPKTSCTLTGIAGWYIPMNNAPEPTMSNALMIGV